MRRILIFLLLFLFPVQLIAGSITLGGSGKNIDCDKNNRRDAGLFQSSAGVFNYSPDKVPGLFDNDNFYGTAAGYSAELLREESGKDTENEYSYGKVQDYSPASVIARSFLLPGLGQRKLGHSIRARIYFALEGAGWIGLGAFTWQSIARKNAYEDYAVAFADVKGTGCSDNYYETIGNYMSSDGPGGYNEDVMRDARDYYPDDEDAKDAYYDEYSFTGVDSWRWVTDRAYDRYNSLRKGSNTAERRAIYALFYMLGLRVISSVDAGRMVMRSNDASKESDSGTSFRIEQDSSGISLFLNRSF